MIATRRCIVVVLWAVHGCAGAPPCVDNGRTKVLIPETRLEAVAGVEVSGVCEVEQPVPACGGTVPRCTALPDGETVMVLEVSSTKRGKCTVTVAFNDGCASETRSFEFGGPMTSCCEDVCAKSQRIMPLPSACTSTP